MSREYRSAPAAAMQAIRVRGAAHTHRLGGLAIPFGRETIIGDLFSEVIVPAAIDLDRDRDVRLLWSHDPSVVLGRVRAKTLSLTTDDTGLFFDADLPDWAGAYIETITRGDVTGMSFGFRVREDRWSFSDDLPHREILDLELLEISAVAWPAYPHTRVGRVRAAAKPPHRARAAGGTRRQGAAARDRAYDRHARERLARVAA